MRLVGYLGMFRKSQEVWARNFDPKGVNASRKPNPGTLCPPPRVIGLREMNSRGMKLEARTRIVFGGNQRYYHRYIKLNFI